MKNWALRCEDCESCKLEHGTKMCAELLTPRPCAEVEADECPLDIVVEDIEEITEKTKDVKIDHGAKADAKKERKAPVRKPNTTKETFITDLAGILTEKGYESVEITNKNNKIEFKIGEKWYRILFAYERDRTEGKKAKKTK